MDVIMVAYGRLVAKNKHRIVASYTCLLWHFYYGDSFSQTTCTWCHFILWVLVFVLEAFFYLGDAEKEGGECTEADKETRKTLRKRQDCNTTVRPVLLKKFSLSDQLLLSTDNPWDRIPGFPVCLPSQVVDCLTFHTCFGVFPNKYHC